MEDVQRFGDRLRELRIRAHLTQRELAEKIGVDFSYLSKIENGVLPPPSDRLILRLAEIFQADKDDLFILAGRIPPDIAELLKNQKTLQLLRAESAKKKMVVKEAKKSSLMTRVPRPRIPVFNFKNFARVAVALVLVIAVGSSLWFVAPHPAKALEIDFSSLPSGNLGTSHSFSITATLGTQDLIPIQSVNITIYNLADTSKQAILANAPLNAGSKPYSAAETGGGAATVTATTAAGWAYVSGTGYAYWKGAGYSFGSTFGYGYSPGTGTTSITYSIRWTSPSGWPIGNYRVKVDIDAESTDLTKTFTETSGSFSLTRAAAPAAPTGGGGEPPPEPSVSNVSNVVNDQGLFTDEARINSDDGNVHISIPEGTTGLINNQPISEISITLVEGPPAPPANTNFIGITYDLEPSGATFDEPITLTFNFNAAWLPEDIDPETGLTIAYYDEATSTWVELDATDIVVDLERGTITANIRHFTYFTVLARVAPAAFTVSDLTISPAEVEIAQKVDISVTVSNTGDLSGSKEVTLQINGKAVSTKRITLGRRASEKVTFATVQGATGTYAVNVEGLSSTFTVKTPPTKPIVITAPPVPAPPAPAPAPAPPAPAPAPAPVPAPEINWVLLAIIALATAIVVGVVLWYFAFRSGS
jgi:transcriptional regulator with XRE-family HTH domain